MKKILSIIMTLVIALSGVTAIAENEDIKVILDGEQMEFDVQPIIENERTLVPMRAIAEALGAEVEWKSPIVTINKDRKRIELSIGNDKMTITDLSEEKVNEIQLDTPAQIVDDRTLVPLRAVSEGFGCTVDWDGDTKTVMITLTEELKKTEEYETSLLQDRLVVTLPNKAENSNSYPLSMRNVKTDIYIPVKDYKLSISVKELFITSVGNLYTDATNLNIPATKLPVIKQNNIEILELANNGSAGDNAVYLGRSFLIKLEDNFLIYLEMTLDSSDIKEEKIFNEITDGIIKTLKRGERNLDLDGGNQYIRGFSINKPAGYVIYLDYEIDYVYRIEKPVTSDKKITSLLSIYKGGFPSYNEEYKGKKPIKTVTGEFSGEEITWQLYEDDNFMQALYKEEDNYYFHIFAYAENAEQQQEFIDIVSSMKYMPSRPAMGGKPVIYLYPEDEQEVSVTLDLDGEFIFTYPEYNGGWTVTAKPDGTIISDGKEYSYLFWEGYMPSFKPDFKEGFVVKGSDSAEFLRETLSKMGLTPKEYNEFIVYWAPKMQENEYNKVYFAKEEYDNAARLNITPEPDSVLRVFMVYEPTSADTLLPEQEIEPFERNGFTVIEWGGYLTK